MRFLYGNGRGLGLRPVVGLGMWGKIAELFELDELFKLLELAELSKLFGLAELFDGFEAHVEAFHRVGERAD